MVVIYIDNKRHIVDNEVVLEIKREAMRQGMKTLRQSALEKLKQGLTTTEEVVRNTSSDT